MKRRESGPMPDGQRADGGTTMPLRWSKMTPGSGDRCKAMLDDIAVLTGGEVIAEDIGIKLENVTRDILGNAKKVLIDRENITTVGGAGEKQDLAVRCNQIRAQVEETTSDYDREKPQERLAKLAGGVAIIYVGGSTEIEVTERKKRVDDGLHATRAAVEEGIVPGSGVALARASMALAKLNAENDDQRVGIEIVRKAAKMPLRQIAENAAADGAVIFGKSSIGASTTGASMPKPASSRTWSRPESSIPPKPYGPRVQHAASVGSLLITTETMVAERRKRERPAVDRPAAMAWVTWTSEMAEQDRPDLAFDAMTARLLRREVSRRAREELNTTSRPSLEPLLARISAEAIADGKEARRRVGLGVYLVCKLHRGSYGSLG